MISLRLIVCLFTFGVCSNGYSALDPEQKRVFDELKAKANAGDPESLHKMGMWFLVGHEPGIPKTDVKTAEFWFLKAADKGFKESFGKLSEIYYDKFAYTKEHNPSDLAEAHKWRLLAVDNDEGMKNVKYFGATPLSEKTRADGEARARKFRAEHAVKNPNPAIK